MIKIAIVDDHKLFRKSLAMLANTFQDMEVVVETDSGTDFLNMLPSTPVDVVLLDIQMPGMSGYDVCRAILEMYSDIKILMISQLTTKESIQQVMECGAHGFITKNSDPDQLELAIKNLQDNGFYLGPELGLLLQEVAKQKKDPFAGSYDEDLIFTMREKQIVRMAAREMSSNEIAAELSIHPRTVETHRNHMIKKVKAKNFIGVILYAVKSKLIQVDSI